MNFKSTNEINTFSFSDCRVVDCVFSQDQLTLSLDALIITAANSQNTRFTNSYADITQARFTNCRIVSAAKDGFRYYNADDVLIKEVPDQPLDEAQLQELLKNLSGSYLTGIEKAEEGADLQSCSLLLEFEEEYGTAGDSYTLLIQFKDAVFEWEHYKNKVNAQ